MTVTEKMIEAACRERCQHEGLSADIPIHYVNSEMFPHMHFAADPLPAHVVGGPRWDGQPITQHKSMPQWRWKFYKSVKRELEAAIGAWEDQK